ncbi:hypothetical protein HAHI6034_10870 [Hathewaya histolytica]|uniref:Tail assembly chaperone n=1 Tax=Hathewaya histolytica TaxID=1498 RepID=A0A4U9RCR4_HATHI|nr:hypothetical protein [Hathewaya histolytica]VTQ88768.1 Uncharacterised protein [Hathewaya histolytica]
MTITSIDDMKKQQYVEATLPGWGIDDTITVKLKHFSLLDAASKGNIPNPLIGPVLDLFKGEGINVQEIQGLKSFSEVQNLFCELCLMEPTFKELKEAGIELTEEQKYIIYQFATGGAKALIPFSRKSKGDGPSEHGPDVPDDTKPVNED